MLDKLLNDFKEKMVAEDISDNTIKNYVSDIKKLVKWYSILLSIAPEVFEMKTESTAESASE